MSKIRIRDVHAKIACAFFFALSASAFAQTPAPHVHAAAPVASPVVAAAPAQSFVVYKSPSCGCCAEWVDHLTAHGIASEVQHLADLNAIKSRYGIAPQYQSCHTAVAPDGYVFEGHIPAPIIQRFRQEKPKGALGLVVPGMPLGSPGMEVDGRFTPYDVLMLRTDGSTAVYARINSPADQRGGEPNVGNSQ